MRGRKMDGFPSREQALKDFFAEWKPNDGIEYIPLSEAAGRVTAASLESKVTLPVYRSSGCDGIAVRSADFAAGMPDYSAWTLGNEFIRADTGDDFDDRFDAVIMIEETDISADGHLEFLSPDITVEAGTNVRKRGSMIKEGELLIDANMPIRAQDLAALAMGGISMVPVWRKPKVAFIPTGSELVPAGVMPKRGENIDTNSLFMKQALIEMGAEPLIFPIAPDDQDILKERLDEAVASADLIVLNAGTAKGSEDFNFGLITSRGKLIHHYVAAAPGRPMALGIIDGKPIINLPGPSLASIYGVRWCVQTAVNRWLHIPNNPGRVVRAKLMEDLGSTPAMAIMMMMRVEKKDGEYQAYPLPGKKAPTTKLLASNGIYVSNLGESHVSAGEYIEVELTRGDEYAAV